MRFPKMWYVRPAKPQISRAYAQSDQSLFQSLEYSMIVKLLTEHNLEFLSLKRLQKLVRVYTCQNVKLLEISCRGSIISESVLPVVSTYQNMP